MIKESDLWDRVYADVRERFRKLIDRGSVAVNGTQTSDVLIFGTDAGDEAELGRLVPFSPTVGKDVYVLNDTIIGEIDDGSGAAITVRRPLILPAGSSGGPWLTSVPSPETYPVGWETTEYFAETDADTPTNNNTGTGVTGGTWNVTTPNVSGSTWRVKGVGSLLFEHSTGGTSVILVRINGVDKAQSAITRCPATGGVRADADGSESGIGPNQTVAFAVRYRPSTAGTTTARNPSAIVTVERTS